MLSVQEYQSVMRGSNYKEHLDSADSFWFGKPDKVDETDFLVLTNGFFGIMK